MTTASVVITGAASGIGLGVARCLHAQGFKIILTDVDQQALNDAVGSFDTAQSEVTAEVLDITSSDDVDAFVERLGDRRVDLLVNNAGLQYVSRLEDFPPERWRYLIDVMLTGSMLMTRALLPRMRSAEFGRIVNIGSIHALVASPFKSAYVAAKHGLVGFSRVVALETADTDITINTICPTYVRTPLVDKQIAAQSREHGISEEEVVEKIMLRPMPKGVFITFEEIAGIVSFLNSNLARNITGQTIVVDGGWTVQ